MIVAGSSSTQVTDLIGDCNIAPTLTPVANPIIKPLSNFGATSIGTCASITWVGISKTLSDALVRPLIAIDIVSASLLTETVDVGPTSYINRRCASELVFASLVIPSRLCASTRIRLSYAPTDKSARFIGGAMMTSTTISARVRPTDRLPKAASPCEGDFDTRHQQSKDKLPTQRSTRTSCLSLVSGQIL